MAMSTSLIGPYDAIPTHEKIRVMCGVPSVISEELFSSLLIQRGVQDKILARLFHIFYQEFNSELNQKAIRESLTNADRETIVNDILNKLALLQTIYENVTYKRITNSLHTTTDELLRGSVSPSDRHGPSEDESDGAAGVPQPAKTDAGESSDAESSYGTKAEEE